MSNTEEHDARYQRAERALEEYFELSESPAGVAPSFEAFVAQHPGLADELCELYALCGEVDQALERGQQAFSAQQAEIRQMLSGLDSAEFAQRYVVEGEVGKGGMGAVYRVIDRKLDRPLAMKVILGQAEASRTGKTPPLAPHQLARFLNEAKITGQLDHPGIVPVHEVGVDHEGRAYFTMKLVKGRTLAEVFEARAADDPEWSTARVLGVIQRVCEALAFAHDRGVIHRDLKPANVMVGAFGEVYVMDWGLARRVGEKDEAVSAEAAAVEEELSAQLTLTREGQLLGTPTYMSPEQASGKLSEIGTASDVYAIGAMLYQLIAGHPPYSKPGEHPSAAAVVARILQGPPKQLIARETPPELIAICEKALARDPKHRYSNTSALAVDLSAYLEGRVVAAYETGALAELRKWVDRNKALAFSAATAVLLLIVGLTTSLIFKAKSDRNAKLAEDNAATATNSERRAVTEEAVAKENERIAKERADDVLRLSALQRLEDLTSEADALWPAFPENVPKYEAWLKRAQSLVEELPQHEKKLAELRAKALPWTDEMQAQQRANHSRLGELESIQRHLTYVHLLTAAEPPKEANAATLGIDWSALPKDANRLNDLAWPLVDPEREDWGGESKGLVLARRAVQLASSLSAAERAAIRDTLAWALFANARFDDAVREEEQAVDEAGSEDKREFEGKVEELKKAIDERITPEGLAAKAKLVDQLKTQASKLEAEVTQRQEWFFADDQDKWWHNQLEKLVNGIHVFADEKTGVFSSGTSEEHGWGMKKRLEFASSIEEQSITGAAAVQRWSAAIASIASTAECPLYAGLHISPQLGLLPIGRDPDSGLWEFAHLQTGEPAERGVDGMLRLKEETGLVFVLLPSGTFMMGAQAKNPSGPNYDPQATSDEGPPHEVALSLFLLSKYEMTQGQWERIAGKNPSYAGPDHWNADWSRSGVKWDLLHPVEQVSWATCTGVMNRLGLELPSEAQWEYGARGNKTTCWWCGTDTESIVSAGNLGDAYGRDHGGDAWGSWESWDDGNTATARVGSYLPNPFGLHDVIGNLWELCRDGYDSEFYRRGPTQDPVAAPTGARICISRGGGFGDRAVHARSAYRYHALTPVSAEGNLGLRPAVSITTRDFTTSPPASR